MTSQQIALVEDTWDFIINNNEDAGMLFYEKLFELDPTLRVLFKHDIRSQAKKLTAMIAFVVLKLRDFDALVVEVRALGARHKQYKVKPEHYGTVGVAFIWTLEKTLGSRWNGEVKQAWVSAYTILSETMMNA